MGITQQNLFNIGANPADVIYTPEPIAIDIIKWLAPLGICLDPCRGEGAFYKFLPNGRDWCEIEEGKDFFDYDRRVDWIIGNPPYSIFEDFLAHSFNLSDHIVFLVPTNKIFQRQKIMQMINNFGGIKGMRIYGSGTTIGLPFGFSVGAFHFAKGYKDDTAITLVTH
jgi:hypothetical protein